MTPPRPDGPHSRSLRAQAKEALDAMSPEQIALSAQTFREIAAAMEQAAVAVENHDYVGVPAAIGPVLEVMTAMVVASQLAHQVVGDAGVRDAKEN